MFLFSVAKLAIYSCAGKNVPTFLYYLVTLLEIYEEDRQ